MADSMDTEQLEGLVVAVLQLGEQVAVVVTQVAVAMNRWALEPIEKVVAVVVHM